jgi:RNA polymerase sigma-70 factor (sigma-E family)
METAQGAALDDFATWVAARRPALLRAAHGITGDADSAEDLLQTALASVLPRWGTLRDRRAADAYVRRAMVNHHHSWYRQAWRRSERPMAEPPDRPTPDAAIELSDPALRATLWELVLQLPPRQRACVVLRHYEGLGERQTADALGCSLGHVKSATSRGLATLRDRLAPHDLAAAA